MEDTSICFSREVDLHVEVDPRVHVGPMMQQESIVDDMSMPKHTMVSDRSQRHVMMYSGIHRDVLPCREVTHLREHADATSWRKHIVMRPHLHHFNSSMGDERWILVYQQIEELRLVVPDDWGLVMTTGEQLSQVPIDVLLVESFGLTKKDGIF